MPNGFADRIEMQHALFARLSAMFGAEVPLYDKSLAVNRVSNRAVCDLLGAMYDGFRVSDEQLELTSGERHGAIRIGRPDELGLIARFFACFAMEPHGFYDMTSIGAKSQPIIATAFRTSIGPEHRIFCSLLQTDYFDEATRQRIEACLAKRVVFSERAVALLEKNERQGGLAWDDAEALIAEATTRIFKWTGRASERELYHELCESGFKIAADIACFDSHHLNHLTPNTLCMDLYTASMRHCLGEVDAIEFRTLASRALQRHLTMADEHHMVLHFRHLDSITAGSLHRRTPEPGLIDGLVEDLIGQFAAPEFRLTELPHAGFKDVTEGPPADTPLLLRQDAYKALTERVVFLAADGSETPDTHTARFGEIEQRFYATTTEGRALYDGCLKRVEAARAEDPGMARRDPEAFDAIAREAFAAFPKTLATLVEAGLVYARYMPTSEGLRQAGSIDTADLALLVEKGFVRLEGIRYEDFLPVSAAGIFASNLNQYGTRSTAASKPAYSAALLEGILGRPIRNPDAINTARQSASILDTLGKLGVIDRLEAAERQALVRDVDRSPIGESIHVLAAS
ncbi:MAG: DUF1338 family protein [Planctomycetota bacterium]